MAAPDTFSRQKSVAWMKGRVMALDLNNHFRIAHFDPDVSLRGRLDLLHEAKVPFALAGRLAVWCYVPPERRAYEGRGFCSALWARQGRGPRGIARGYRVREFEHRGYGAKRPGVVIDFIHRHPAAFAVVLEAVKAARKQRKRLRSAT